jgi:Flp pilus assembly protein TadG
MAGLVRRWRRLARDARGAAAMEFAMLAPVFLLTIMAVFDVSWMFTRNMALDSATRAVARDIRTGEVYLAADPEAEFRQRLCAEMILVDCGTVLVDVRDAGFDFSAVTEPADFTSDSFETYLDPTAISATEQMGVVNFTAGNPESVMTVRTAVEHRFLTPYIHRLWGDNNGTIRFSVTEVFRNEPFPDNS